MIVYRVNRKIVYAFSGLSNKKYVTDLQNLNVNLSVKGQLR